ncbi:MAG: metal ABC transporter ATP-binding protein [Candidatus Sungiibacteriota bacterium]
MPIVDHNANSIEISHISFSYGNNEVLRDITFAIHRGDYLGVVGPNGAGKTTLLKIMLGLLTPSAGQVKIFGTEVRDFKEWPRIGYVPQKALNFDTHFPATVGEVVLMGRFAKRGLFRFVAKEDKIAMQDALKTAEMWQYRDRLIGDLSGGEQQRVFIARALVTAPEIIFLDEPTTGVDAKSQEEFYALLRKLNREAQTTLVLVSHDIDRVLGEAMHIACIDRTLVCHGSPEDYRSEGGAARQGKGFDDSHYHKNFL